MTPQHDNLIRMANRIGDFFAAQPDREAALAGVAEHIRNFWDPRMRAAMRAFLETHPDGVGAGACLNAITLEALQRHGDALLPRE
ncbi:MAG TPA: formate dehydrogenase subunit delta [Burkholderiaceae bacterium]|nr:formate dehydrogenase subunit delta [Burkholderiaceae bacterium]